MASEPQGCTTFGSCQGPHTPQPALFHRCPLPTSSPPTGCTHGAFSPVWFIQCCRYQAHLPLRHFTFKRCLLVQVKLLELEFCIEHCEDRVRKKQNWEQQAFTSILKGKRGWFSPLPTFHESSLLASQLELGVPGVFWQASQHV